MEEKKNNRALLTPFGWAVYSFFVVVLPMPVLGYVVLLGFTGGFWEESLRLTGFDRVVSISAFVSLILLGFNAVGMLRKMIQIVKES